MYKGKLRFPIFFEKKGTHYILIYFQDKNITQYNIKKLSFLFKNKKFIKNDIKLLHKIIIYAKIILQPNRKVVLYFVSF